VASVAVAGGLIAVGASAARPAGASLATAQSSAFLDSEPGEYVGQGQQYSFPTVSCSCAGNDPEFTVTNANGDSFQVWLAPPTPTTQFTAGTTYENAQREPFQAAGHPGLDVSGDHRGCNTDASRFIVDDASYDGSGNLLTFSVRFEQHCEGMDPALFGELSYNSTADYRTVSMSPPAGMTIQSSSAQATGNYTVTNNGPSSLDPSGFNITGANAGDFAITGNTCTSPLVAGAACTVAVTYARGASLTSHAVLSYYDELAPQAPGNEPAGAGTGRDVALTGTTSAASLSTNAIPFGYQRVGTFGKQTQVTLTNTGGAPLTIAGRGLVGDYNDFLGSTDCGSTLAAGAACHFQLYAAPIQAGSRSAQLQIDDSAADSPQTVDLSEIGTEGYFLYGSAGEVATGGDARYQGDVSNAALAYPIVGLAASANGSGYYLAASNGGIFSFAAPFYGSASTVHLAKPIVGMAATPSGHGYWLVASDGGICTFGDARFHGSTGNVRLAKPIVGMATTPDGNGYWLVASDGGIFTFGDARFHGSTGNVRLTRPIVGMAVTPDGNGYWLDASDGGVFTFGDAPFYGSLGGQGVTDAVGLVGSAPPLPPDLAAHARLLIGRGYVRLGPPSPH
jgi:hypothetical protein